MTNDIGEPHSYTVVDDKGRRLRGPLWDIFDAMDAMREAIECDQRRRVYLVRSDGERLAETRRSTVDNYVANMIDRERRVRAGLARRRVA
jgi:hypothetical protein